MLERYILPIAPYVFTALNALLCIFFFLCLESELRLLKKGRPNRAKDSSVQELKVQVEELSLRLRDAEERAGIATVPEAPKASLNLNKRTQVIRMSRRGEPVENIAAYLSIPRKEVELLLKIHGLILKGSDVLNSTNQN